MTAIIFGASGQDGFYLSDLLHKEGVKPICISRHGALEINGDVSDYPFVEKVIKKYMPSFIFHFAAKSTTQHSALFENHQSICTGTINILEAVRLFCPLSKVFISGSAMQFKNDGLPIDEKTLFEGSSAYSVARIQSAYAARYYRDKFGLNVYLGYLFNHDSPLRTENHINQKIVKAVKRIVKGSTEKISLGNIDVKKEFNYAGDIVEAVWLLINQDKVFETVIGSGEVHSIEEWVKYCFNKIDRDWKDFVQLESDFTPEYKVLCSNPALIKSMGWQPKTNFYQLADLMVERG